MIQSTLTAQAVSAPGRICLFGEHQDYLGLPVIPCAISLRVRIDAAHRSDRNVVIALPDIGGEERFSLDGPLPYIRERDYFRSAVNVLRRDGYTFSRGIDAIVCGRIPINTGTSSSSALVVAWVHLLAQMSDQAKQLEPVAVAKYAHLTEVVEFGEPGGMMDHYSTALGGVIFLEFSPRTAVLPLMPLLGSFVLGDSGEPKDTRSILSRVKDQVVAISAQLSKKHPEFSLAGAQPGDVERYEEEMTGEQAQLLKGTLANHQITLQALSLLRSPHIDHRRLGELMNEHQRHLRDGLRISTPKIDRMLDAALNAGAYGGKINGSGGGGCMFVYAPERTRDVAESIERAGGRVFIVTPDVGTRSEHIGGGCE